MRLGGRFKAIKTVAGAAMLAGLGGCALGSLPGPIIGSETGDVAVIDGSSVSMPPPSGALHSGWGETSVIPAHYGIGQDGPYRLDSGDRLRVFVYGQPNLSRGYTVDHDGAITVPLIGAVEARGLTTAEVEDVIKARLGAQFVRDPQVTVDIQQNRPFFILGEVKAAGQYPYVSGMTIESAVAIAGGYSERASDSTFRVTRRINGAPKQIEVPADFLLRPGDTVFVHERFL